MAELARSAPNDDAKEVQYAAVHKLRIKYGFSIDDKIAEVLECIRLGAVTINDIAAETGFRSKDVYELVAELERRKQIRTTPYSDGSRGRPPVMIKLIT